MRSSVNAAHPVDGHVLDEEVLLDEEILLDEGILGAIATHLALVHELTSAIGRPTDTHR